LLSCRLESREAFAALTSDPWEEWKTVVAEQLTGFLDDPEVVESIDELKSIAQDGTLSRAEAQGDKLAPVLSNLLRLWQDIEAARRSDDYVALSRQVTELKGSLKAKGRKAAWEPHRPKETISRLQSLYRKHLGWTGNRGISLALDRELAEALVPLGQVFRHAQKRYGQLKGERSALDFDDLEQGALDLLSAPGNEAIRRRWQEEVRALLVDEFQDTNDRQRQIILLLNGEEHKLFLVGDARQSIYRFRGADVTVFSEERDRIPAEGGEAFKLSTSYRTPEPLLGYLNDLLRPVLGDEEDPKRPWVTPFEALEAFRGRPANGITSPPIELHLTLGTKSSGALERAAQALAGRLIELVETQRITLSDSSEAGSAHRYLDYGDIAVLCRASSSFRAYEDAFERAHVPYVTVAGRRFYARPEIRDLLNVLQALTDPTDDLALAGALRSPAFALSDVALFHLADWQRTRDLLPRTETRPHADAFRPQALADPQPRPSARGRPIPSLWATLIAKGRDLPEPDGQRAARAMRIIGDLHRAAGRTTVAEVLKATLDATGYLAMLTLSGMHRAVRNVDKLLADAHNSRMVSTGEFLEYIHALRDVGAREGEARSAGQRAIQIMTVHAAKGLEFPIVILGDLTYGKGFRAPLLLTDPEQGPLLKLENEDGNRPAIYQLGLSLEVDKENAESRRLLYVAATRAREMLLLSACVPVSSAGKISCKGWLKWLGDEDALGLTGCTVSPTAQQTEPEEVPLRLRGRPVRCVIYPDGYVAPVRAISQEQSPTTSEALASPLLAQPRRHEVAEELDTKIAEEEASLSSRVWRVVPRERRTRPPAAVVGQMVHAALKHWRYPDEGFDAWSAALARRCGLIDARQVRNAQNETKRILERFRAHPLYLEMNAARRLHELPYSIETGDKIEQGRMDLLYQIDGAGWTLVEFKTHRIASPSALDGYLSGEDYAQDEKQVLRYAAAVEKLAGERPRVLLCLLNCWDGVRVREI